MSLLIGSVIRRHLKPTGRYSESTPTQEVVVPLDNIPSEERVIGWYKNPEPWDDVMIGFTEHSILNVEGGRVSRILFDDILGYDTPDEKSSSTGIVLRTRNGSHYLRFAGGSGTDLRYRDTFRLIAILRTILFANESQRDPR